MHPVKLLERAATGAVYAIRHPLSSTAYAAGMARGLAGAVIHGSGLTGGGVAAGKTEPSTEGAGSSSTATTTTTKSTATAPPRPQRVPKPVPDPADLPEPIVIEASDDEPGEAFATEPKAVSRESAHGGSASVDAEVDTWEDEARQGLDAADDVDIETPVGTTGAEVGNNPHTAEADLQQPDTPPLLDPSVVKAVRSESETLRKAAERDPE